MLKHLCGLAFHRHHLTACTESCCSCNGGCRWFAEANRNISGIQSIVHLHYRVDDISTGALGGLALTTRSFHSNNGVVISLRDDWLASLFELRRVIRVWFGIIGPALFKPSCGFRGIAFPLDPKWRNLLKIAQSSNQLPK